MTMPHGAGDISRIHCRKCGYDLRGQTAPYRCPECGTVFNPANRRTYRTRPLRWAIGWWVKRAILLLVLPVVLAVASWAWLYWGWYSERSTLEEIGVYGDDLAEPLGGQKLRALLGSAGWVLDRVRYVALPAPAVDDDLVPLKEFGQLEGLCLAGTQVTDAGLVGVLGLKKLRELVMYEALTDAGLDCLIKRLTAIQTLDLSDTLVTDAGLVHLKGLTSLKELHLSEKQATDAGVAHIRQIQGLRDLRIWDGRLSAERKQQLQAALPGVTINRPDRHAGGFFGGGG